MIKKLNANYRNKNKPTDVLSFELKDVDMFGEIYISLQRATIQARRFGISYDEEILRLFVHGLFHLQGYDHEIESEREKMEKMEQKYINF
jgi:probable rRNA maturation factor